MKAKQTKSALIIGASGLVGKLLLEAILQKDYYVSITLVLRRSIDLKYDKRVKIITISDFDALDQYEEDLFSEDVFCCLGSTMKKAGSKSTCISIVPGPCTLSSIIYTRIGRVIFLFWWTCFVSSELTGTPLPSNG